MILLPLKQKLPGQQGQSAQNKGYPHHRQLTPGALSRGGAGMAAGSLGSPASSGAAWFSGGRASGFLSPLGSPPQAEMTLLRRDPLGQVCPDHPVGGGGIEPVPGKKARGWS